MAVKVSFENIIVRKDSLERYRNNPFVKEIISKETKGIYKSDNKLIVMSFMSTLELDEMLKKLTQIGLIILSKKEGGDTFQDLAVLSSGFWGVLANAPPIAYPCYWLEINQSDFTVSMKE